MSQSDYVIRCCLGRQVVVIEGLKETAEQLRGIGNNLNRLTVLANMGRVDAANLDKAPDMALLCVFFCGWKTGRPNSRHT